MVNLILELSKYVMIFLMAVYTWANFRYFSFPDRERKLRLCARQNHVMFFMHFLAYMTLFLKAEDEKTSGLLAAFYAAQAVFFLVYIFLTRRFYRNVSRILVNNTCMLLAVGLIMLSRLSMFRADPLDKALKQFVIICGAAVVSWLIPWIMERFWQIYKFQWIYAAVGILALLAVWIGGDESFGAQLSFTIGGISIQPSEFVKLTFVLFTASMFYQSTELKQVCITTAAAAAHVLILVLSKDLGGALILFVSYVLMLFIATGKKLYLFGGIGLGCGAAAAAFGLFDHVKRRVAAWKNPWADIDNTGYQITQSLFAIGRGGLFGQGIGKGTPQDIPYVETDFIFAALTEEMGLLFGIGILLTAVLLFLSVMRLAAGLADGFYRNLAVGFGMLYIFQTFLTVGGGTKFIPLTGVTLPFISYGGSSVMSMILIFAVLEGVWQMRYEEEQRIEKQKRKREKQLKKEE